MKTNLLSDFVVDKPAKTVTISREFEAELSLVWDAFTKKEFLDQWNAPAPYTANTKYMHFEEGGKRLYAMISPQGDARWIIQEFSSIRPRLGFNMYNAFSDENGNPEPQGSEWEYTFSQNNGITCVKITIFNESFERMETLLAGFRDGMNATLIKLEQILSEH